MDERPKLVGRPALGSAAEQCGIRASTIRETIERSAPDQRRIDSKRLAYLDQTFVQRVQTGTMM